MRLFLRFRLKKGQGSTCVVPEPCVLVLKEDGSLKGTLSCLKDVILTRVGSHLELTLFLRSDFRLEDSDKVCDVLRDGDAVTVQISQRKTTATPTAEVRDTAVGECKAEHSASGVPTIGSLKTANGTGLNGRQLLGLGSSIALLKQRNRANAQTAAVALQSAATSGRLDASESKDATMRSLMALLTRKRQALARKTAVLSAAKDTANVQSAIALESESESRELVPTDSANELIHGKCALGINIIADVSKTVQKTKSADEAFDKKRERVRDKRRKRKLKQKARKRNLRQSVSSDANGSHK